MPFARPTLTELRKEVAGDIATGLPGADALLRRSNLKVLGDAQAALASGHYGFLDWISKQAVPFTSVDEYLVSWAALKGVFLRQATKAAGTVTFTGTVGAVIPNATPAQRGDGVSYSTVGSVAIGGGGSITVPAVAAEAAVAGNAEAGTVLTLGISVPGVQSAGVAATDFTGGADVENMDSLRSRMLQVYAAPPQGGSLSDYIEWALSVAGVTRAWVLPNGMGVGTVVVYTMFDVAEAVHGGFPQGSDGAATDETRDTPATGDQLAVANYIFNLQPVTALVYSVAPTQNVVNFTIDQISTASADTKAAIAQTVAAVFLRYGGPGGAFDATRVEQGTVPLSYIEASIAAISGTTGFVITAPAANITSGAGQIPVCGTVSYT